MQLEKVLGYAGALLIGLILGLLGGGGALLATPVLVYLFHLETSVATGYSMFLVAITASSGAVQNIRKKLLDYPVLFCYGLPSVITIFVIRRFVLPALPKVICTIGNFSLTKSHFILTILSITMFFAAYKMIFTEEQSSELRERHKNHYLILILYSILIGTLMGLIGVGGGFLIVPALIYFANLPTKKAIGTSLVIIAANSYVGFLGDISAKQILDWAFLASFALFSTAGVLIGHYLLDFIQPNKLRKWFGWLIFLTAVYIIIKELIAR